MGFGSVRHSFADSAHSLADERTEYVSDDRAYGESVDGDSDELPRLVRTERVSFALSVDRSLVVGAVAIAVGETDSNALDGTTLARSLPRPGDGRSDVRADPSPVVGSRDRRGGDARRR